ncbi:MAG: hypothetical protein KME12_02570 [Trichocoleus desertorum ATA4-8-CV12]|nr:hypothetical protein [Trichocoleus desertorum ATA4-8-CV12]
MTQICRRKFHKLVILSLRSASRSGGSLAHKANSQDPGDVALAGLAGAISTCTGRDRL